MERIRRGRKGRGAQEKEAIQNPLNKEEGFKNGRDSEAGEVRAVRRENELYEENCRNEGGKEQQGNVPDEWGWTMGVCGCEKLQIASQGAHYEECGDDDDDDDTEGEKKIEAQ